jgi:predicted flavoprotein YhiN
MAWFASMGVTLKREETGKLFPTTDRARTVVDALLRACDGVEIRTAHRVETMERGFAVHTSRGTITASRVILATGGRSVPKTGSDGHGYEIVRAFGHTITPVFPALVPLIVEEGHWLTRLSGTSVDAELFVVAGKVVARQRGSLLFTHFGISGPVALDISRHWIATPNATLVANFLPGESFESVERAMIAEARRNPRATVVSLLRVIPSAHVLPSVRVTANPRVIPSAARDPRRQDASRAPAGDPSPALGLTGGVGATPRRVPERLLAALTWSGGPSARPEERQAESLPLHKLTKEERRRIVRALVELPIPVVRDRGFDYAEVTAGGVPLTEIDLASMASRRCDGLFLCGEILNVDGRIGGYNFQWAWASGRLAGIHAARSLHTSQL